MQRSAVVFRPKQVGCCCNGVYEVQGINIRSAGQTRGTDSSKFFAPVFHDPALPPNIGTYNTQDPVSESMMTSSRTCTDQQVKQVKQPKDHIINRCFNCYSKRTVCAQAILWEKPHTC